MVKALLVAAAAAAFVASTSTATNGQVTLKGVGASFPETIYKKWFSAAGGWNAKVNYDAAGSGAGVKALIAGTVDFAASDDAVDDADIKKVSRGVVHIPTVGGAIGVVYNKAGCDLKLSQSQLVDVFLGKIKDFKDLGCAAGAIKVGYRSDSSGTTAGFTSSLLAFSGAWKSVGAGKTVKWPVGVGKDGSSGVASFVQSTPNSISYVSFGSAKEKGLRLAALQNKAGKFVAPSPSTIGEGLSQIKLDARNRGVDANPAGGNSYPIVSYTWILAYQTGNKNLEAIRNTLSYVLSSKAQDQAEGLGFVKLPGAVRTRSASAVLSLK